MAELRCAGGGGRWREGEREDAEEELGWEAMDRRTRVRRRNHFPAVFSAGRPSVRRLEGRPFASWEHLAITPFEEHSARLTATRRRLTSRRVAG